MARALESQIARLLTIGTYASIGCVAIGVVALLASGVSPFAAAPALDLARLGGDIAALQPAGFLWLGLLGLIATPAARVAAALVGYSRSGERTMVVVAALILVVIAIGVAAGVAAG
jgi:uncharacterized membrane protein